MEGIRKEDWALLLSGAAAVCPVISIAGFEILMGAALVALVVTRQRLRVPRIWIPFSLWVLGTLISLFASGHVRQGLPQVKKFYLFLMVVIVFSAFKRVAQIRWLAAGWALGASFSSVWSLEQFFRKYEKAEAAHQSFYTSYVGSRITGFMSHWMTLSGELMMALLVIAAVVLFCADRRAIWWFVGAGAIICAGLIAAYSRGYWLGTAGGAVYLLWSWRKWAVIAAPVFVGILMLANPAGVRERIMSAFHPSDLDSNAFRELTRHIGYRMIRAHPLLGVGPEQVGPQHMDYLPPDTPRPLPDGYYQHLHNIYIHFAAERGIPTMLALIAMIVLALFDFLRELWREGPFSDQKWVLHAAVAAIVGILLSGWEEVNLGDSEVLAMFFVILACGYVAIEEARKCRA